MGWFERFRFSVRMVPLWTGVLLFYCCCKRKGRFRFQLRFLKKGSDSSGFRFRFGSWAILAYPVHMLLVGRFGCYSWDTSASAKGLGKNSVKFLRYQNGRQFSEPWVMLSAATGNTIEPRKGWPRNGPNPEVLSSLWSCEPPRTAPNPPKLKVTPQWPKNDFWGVSQWSDSKVTQKWLFDPKCDSKVTFCSGQGVTFESLLGSKGGNPQKSLFSHFWVTLDFRGSGEE